MAERDIEDKERIFPMQSPADEEPAELGPEQLRQAAALYVEQATVILLAMEDAGERGIALASLIDSTAEHLPLKQRREMARACYKALVDSLTETILNPDDAQIQYRRQAHWVLIEEFCQLERPDRAIQVVDKLGAGPMDSSVTAHNEATGEVTAVSYDSIEKLMAEVDHKDEKLLRYAQMQKSLARVRAFARIYELTGHQAAQERANQEIMPFADESEAEIACGYMHHVLGAAHLARGEAAEALDLAGLIPESLGLRQELAFSAAYAAAVAGKRGLVDRAAGLLPHHDRAEFYAGIGTHLAELASVLKEKVDPVREPGGHDELPEDAV